MDIGTLIIIGLIALEICITVLFAIYGSPKDWFKPDLRCEAVGCGKVAKLYKTKDKTYWMCHKCMKLYNRETV